MWQTQMMTLLKDETYMLHVIRNSTIRATYNTCVVAGPFSMKSIAVMPFIHHPTPILITFCIVTCSNKNIKIIITNVNYYVGYIGSMTT